MSYEAFAYIVTIQPRVCCSDGRIWRLGLGGDGVAGITSNTPIGLVATGIAVEVNRLPPFKRNGGDKGSERDE